MPTDIGRTILTTVRDLPFGLGKTGLAKVLLGNADAALRSDRCAAFGALGSMARGKVVAALDALIEQGLIEIEPDDEYRRIRLTERGSARLRAPGTIAAAPQTRPQRPRVSEPVAGDAPLTSEESDRFEVLRAWRLRVAREQGVPPYVVFHDTVLRAIARANPITMGQLLTVPGVGHPRTQKYGTAILSVLRDAAKS
ncbi:MAG: hypothetical protein FJX72_13695 [Armatimonadetes bacterium]|nr:hypothetical protein [Armatimonadota bacterium]